MFTVKSKTERGVLHRVNMEVDVCTCPKGIDRSPCSHQSAVAVHYSAASINCVTTLASNIHQIYAQIALGGKTTKTKAFMQV